MSSLLNLPNLRMTKHLCKKMKMENSKFKIILYLCALNVSNIKI